MKKPAHATAPLLAWIAALGLILGLFVRSWAAGHSSGLLLQALPAAAAYAGVVWVLAHMLDIPYLRTLTGSLHVLAVPVIAAAVLLAVAVTAAEKATAAKDQQPPWGVMLAQLVQHGIKAMRTAVA